MNEMVEKAAQALCEWNYKAQHAFSKPWEKADEHYRDWYRGLARATIEAIRQPSKAMLDAGSGTWGCDDDPADVGTSYRAMIDAALE